MVGYGLSLLLVAAIVAGALALAWRRRVSGPIRRSAGVLRTLEFAPLGPNARLVLAECDGRRYLLAQAANGVTLVDRWGDGLPQPSAAAPGFAVSAP